MSDSVKNWNQIKLNIADRAKLVAVSKTISLQEIEIVLQSGQRVFGENRIQEAQSKWSGLKLRYPDVELHLLGPLQSNKVADAVELFDVIQTVDRPKIAKALATEMQKQGRYLPCFVQVNIGQEQQKAGVDPAELGAFLQLVKVNLGLNIVGLMCIPPAAKSPQPYFKALAQMAEQNGLTQLSMGMSGDYLDAIAEGATCVRVGSAIFGGRLQITK